MYCIKEIMIHCAGEQYRFIYIQRAGTRKNWPQIELWHVIKYLKKTRILLYSGDFI